MMQFLAVVVVNTVFCAMYWHACVSPLTQLFSSKNEKEGAQ